MPTEVAERVPARARRPAVSVGVPILASKITAPSVPDWAIPRPRITKLIAEGTRWCRLTVVTGPAGAGKTMALALWMAAEPGTVAWVSVDEFDNRPGMFWAYVVAALRNVGPGLRLAAISRCAHPDPDQFAAELITGDGAVTGYLVQEVRTAQPPEVRDVLLSTSILEHISAEAASELAGDERAEEILLAMAHANAFAQPIGSGRYRYHTLFAEMLRLKLRREHPDRIAPPHRRAARWYERHGQLTDAVRHAAQAGDWSALRLAEPQQLRLPSALERSWIEPVLRRDPKLARAHLMSGNPRQSHPRPCRQHAAPGPPVPPALMPRRPLRLLRSVKALRSAATASRSGRT